MRRCSQSLYLHHVMGFKKDVDSLSKREEKQLSSYQMFIRKLTKGVLKKSAVNRSGAFEKCSRLICALHVV